MVGFLKTTKDRPRRSGLVRVILLCVGELGLAVDRRVHNLGGSSRSSYRLFRFHCGDLASTFDVRSRLALLSCFDDDGVDDAMFHMQEPVVSHYWTLDRTL